MHDLPIGAALRHHESDPAVAVQQARAVTARAKRPLWRCLLLLSRVSNLPIVQSRRAIGREKPNLNASGCSFLKREAKRTVEYSNLL